MSYKKRARAGWCTSKKECKEKIYKERQYEKEEIKQAFDEIEAGDDYRYRWGGNKKKNEKARMEYRIKYYEQMWQTYGDRYSWFGSYKARAREERKKYFEKYGDKNKELRRCNYCRLDTPTKEEDCTICNMSKPNK
tara:strand:- start:12930 stop:13337 length:408 start_codon:yes stop_codon:yes gene_type:complete